MRAVNMSLQSAANQTLKAKVWTWDGNVSYFRSRWRQARLQFAVASSCRCKGVSTVKWLYETKKSRNLNTFLRSRFIFEVNLLLTVHWSAHYGHTFFFYFMTSTSFFVAIEQIFSALPVITVLTLQVVCCVSIIVSQICFVACTCELYCRHFI